MSDEESWNGETVTVQGSGIHYIMRTQDSVYHSEAQYVPGVGLLKAVELPQLKAPAENSELQSHTLMIRDIAQGKMFACLNCKLHYASANDFKRAHNIEVEEDQVKIEPELIEEPQWVAVPNTEAEEQEIILEEIIEEDIKEEICENVIKEEEVYCCFDCGVSFSSLEAAEKHVCETENAEELPESKQHEEKIYTCEICNISFRAEKYLIGHRKIHEERPTRSIKEALPANMQENYPQKDQFFCEICDKSFDSNLLLIHKNMHLSGELLQNTCGICNRDFYTKETYDMHMKLHVGKNLHKHAQTVQSENCKVSGRFKCQYCDKYFKRPYEKISHERVHTGEKPYACEVCGKRFRVSYSLTMHLRTHTDVRPYECEVCQKRFKSQPVYAHHKRIHSNQRSFQCDTCNKTFQTSVQLAAHRNSHFKPFVCTVCNRAFAALFLLRTHMQTHQSPATATTNEAESECMRSCKCEMCGASFENSLALRQHMTELHELTDICTETFDYFDEQQFLAENAEIIDEKLSDEEQHIPFETGDFIDAQSALLIEVANAAEQFDQQEEAELPE